MEQHKRFRIRSLDQLRTEINTNNLDLPVTEDTSVLGTSLEVAGKTIPNRLTVQPMEGFDADEKGRPGPLSFRRYKRYAAGGSSLIWFEATAVVPEARSNPRQFWLHQDNIDTFRELVDETRRVARDQHAREPMLILQMTHSGRYSKPTGAPAPLIAHRSEVLDPKHDLPADYPLVSDEYLDKLQDKFVELARLAQAAGFDGVDIKSCHRYLVSELLASFTREGKYGGSYENRTRFLRETFQKIRSAVPELVVTTRMNAYDAIPYPYGFGVNKEDYTIPDLTEPLQLIDELQELGAPLLNISIGNPYYNPHYGRPYDFPIKGMSPPAEYPLEAIDRFYKIIRTLQQKHPELPVIGSGYTWLRQYMPYVAAGVIQENSAALIGQGRGAFAYPDSVNDILQKGAMEPDKCCITCSACTQIMRDGGRTGCVVRDKEIYGPQYRLARRYALDRLLEEAERCRDCEQATCTKGCPAGIDVPAFIKAFADQDYEQAYNILREKNVLPEMCGMVCPADVQCQGECLEDIFCKNPIAIQDIQLVAARTARLKGLTGVRLPARETGRKIAVLGGGPGSIACAAKLLEKGNEVTLFEKSDKLGGTPDQTIPEQRYGNSEAEIEALLAPALAAGRLEIKYGCSVGENVDFREIREEYDSVYLGFGLNESTQFGEAKGAVGALNFLKEVKTGFRTEIPEKVAVLGGGNTAMDAAREAERLGAQDVYIVYRRSFLEMPAWPEERDAALEEGVHFLMLTQPLGYETDAGGNLTGVKIARTELGEPDESGRRRPQMIEGSESVLPTGLAVEAIGQTLSRQVRNNLADVPFTEKGLVAVKPGKQQTETEDIFAGGDIVNGGATAVEAIRDGMLAAEEIDEFITEI